MTDAASAGSSPRLSLCELAGVALLGSVLALVMHWPLPLHMGRDIAQDLGDPLVQAWQVAWDGHALVHQPGSLFQANMFWPLRDSLAFSDALVGYAPIGLIGSGTHAAIERYDVLFLFAYALCFAGAWLLARELGANRTGAAIAGLAFAYAPWRIEQQGHLHVLSSGGIPLALFLLLRGYRRGSAATILAGWLVATWQFSLGFTLGLMLLYVLAAATIVTAVVWWRRGRPQPPRGVVVASCVGMLCFGVTAILLARPYLRVLHDHPEAHRTIQEVASFSGPPYEFLAASRFSRVWSAATSPVRGGLGFVAEMTLFPGIAVLALALAGWRIGALAHPLRRWLAIAALAFAVLSLGFKLNGLSWLYPYRWLYELLPGWQGIRVPGRLQTLTTLCLALLAAAGAQAIAARARRRWGATTAAAIVALLSLAILAEGWGFANHPTVPLAPLGERAAPQPALHLPLGAFDNRRYVLWSTDGFPRLVNGRGSFIPRQFVALSRVAQTFPDARSVAYLRRLGVRSVSVHLDHTAPSSPLRQASTRSLRGLHLKRTRHGPVVLFVLR
jgi:hypothetical protein